DKFNVRAYNTLNLYDKQIRFDYEMVDTGPIRVRLQKDGRAMLGRYVPRLLGEAFASMKTRYNFVPKLPVQVEIYNSREQFSVRTHGLPNIGIQGVCFGNMIAAISPSAEPFNWGNVLWHELGHVFAIQMSKNHVPRWFTEGLSEYETIARRPEWQREMDRDLYLALRRGSLPKLEDMNKAFTHVESVDDVAVAYYASSQLVVFLVERFGMPKVVEALRLWGKGETSPMVLEHAFGVPASELDRSFRSWAEKRLSRYASQFVFDERARSLALEKAEVEKNPKSAKAHVAYAIALLRSRNLEEAKKEVQTAFALEPKNIEAHFLSSKWEKDPAEKLSHLRSVVEGGGDGYDARMALAVVAKKEKDLNKVRSLLEDAHRFDPGQPEPVRHLLELLEEEKLAPAPRLERELGLVSTLANLDQHDGKTWQRWLEILVEKGRWEEATKVGDGAVYVDVFNAKIHALYSDALLKQGNVVGARWEAESALLGDLDPASTKRLLQRLRDTSATKEERDSLEKKIRALESVPAPSSLPPVKK
nr:hypothetical protein [Polyangiaceae bacterium]